MSEKFFNEPYGFIYITTNLENGKKYVGRCCVQTTNCQWKTYLGSGKSFKLALKKHGRNNFKRNIISFAYSNEELNDQEYKIIKFLNAVKSEDYYNMCDGGNYENFWKSASEEQKQDIIDKVKKNNFYNTATEEDIRELKDKMSKKMSGENNPFYGKHHTEESKQIMSEKASKRLMGDGNPKPWLGVKSEDHPLYGKHFTEESRNKMSESAKNKFKNGFINGRSKQWNVKYLESDMHFNTQKDFYDFVKINKLMLNKNGQPCCYDIFKRAIKNNEKIKNLEYTLV